MDSLPTVPVVVIHLYENVGINGEARTICSDSPMPFIHDGMYPLVPRWPCPLCHYYETYYPADNDE
jgi:hypothetical protein